MLAQVRGLELLGVIKRLRENFVYEYGRLHERHGDLIWFGWPLQFYLALHPKDVEHVLLKNARNYRKSRNYRELGRLLGEGLVTAEGATWKHNRSALSPEFTKARVTQDIGLIVECTREWIAQGALGNVGPSPNADGTEGGSEVIAVDSAAAELVFRLAAESLFGSQARGAAREVSRHLALFMHRYVERAYAWIKVPAAIPSRGNRDMKRSVEALDEILADVVRQARQADDSSTNVLRRLLRINETTPEAALSDRALRDEMVTLLMAGHETTANALSWSLLLLAQHPEAQQRLYQEVQDVLGDETPSAETLQRLSFCDWILLEAMRLYPPVPGVSREALAADELSGVPIAAGSRVELSMWVTHRHPEYWDEPDAFRPERFAPERREKQPRFAYFPFAGGPRICLGAEMAKLELKIMLAMCIRNFEFEVTGEPPTPYPTVTLRPYPALELRVKRR